MRQPAAVVTLEDVEDEIEELERLGVYDDSRSVVRRGETAELPVEERLDGYDIVEQQEPVPRKRSLEDIVNVEDPPSGWTTIGEAALVDLQERSQDEREEIARGVMEVDGVDTVLDYRGVSGETREPEVEHVAGDDDTETTHREHGVSYRLDPAKVMFSAGNQRERRRVQETVEAGERVLDMFAGVGYWTLPAAVAGADVAAVEVNPSAAGYLREGVEVNDVADQVTVYEGDCRDVVPELEVTGFDRVYLGYFDAREPSYLEAAFTAVEAGTVLHLHDAAAEPVLQRAAEAAETLAREHGFAVDVDTRRVKSYSEGVFHVVHDVEVVQ